MAYKIRKNTKSLLTSVETFEGETIEQKIERIVENKEPIKDGAPEIFTERKDGVLSAYNIRTDRWEIATEAMDAVSRNIAAKREEKGKMEIVKDDKKKEEVTEGKTVQGKTEGNTAKSEPLT